MVLNPEEYDASYFDGALQRFMHNAGYSTYERWHRHESNGPRGEFWADLANALTAEFSLKGKRVLEIGCAKGFLITSLRNEGVLVEGIDVSDYAVSCAETPEYVHRGNVLDYVQVIPDKTYDFLFSRLVLECFSDDELATLVPELNRVSLQQLHAVSVDPRHEFYNGKSLEEWRSLSWVNAEIRN